MPYTNIWKSDGLYRKFTGEVAGDEILSSNFELHNDPRFWTIKYIINDFTEISGHSIKIAHTKAYAISDEVISSNKGRLKIALVVAQSEYLPLANNYRDLMEGQLFECQIFRSVDDAKKWVGAE